MGGIVGRLGATTNLTHAFIYFADEATAEYEALGLSTEQQYFASRGAALGPVGPEIVQATFFNFCPAIVEAAIPAAWAVADPVDIQAARLRAAGTVFRAASAELDADHVDAALAIAQAMVDGVGDEGKPLAAANRAVAVPDDPHIRLWQLITIIREWRGDAHVAVLSAAPLSAVEALVLHVATGVVSESVIRTTRAWPDTAWAAATERLAGRGLVHPDGSFTEEGRAYRERIEDLTDRASQPLVDAVGDDAASRLCDLLKPIRLALIESGVFTPTRRRRD